MILRVVNDLMGGLGLAYEFGELHCDGDPPPLYFVGDLIEAPAIQEDWRESGQVVLGGWSRAGVQPLLDARDAVRSALGGSLRATGADGAVVVEYSHSTLPPSDVEGIDRLEISLNYYEWRVN